MNKIVTKSFHLGKILFAVLLFSLFTSCGENQSIVNNVDEREANEIIVFLASKGISAQKIKAVSSGVGAGRQDQNVWNITVSPNNSVEAMALLNQVGLPRRKGTTLLELFAKQGLMTSDKEKTIRYQAGLEEELTNTIRKIDGVIDADVQISFPTTEELTTPTTAQKKIKAAVYVKHQGVLDDPNNHLEAKIKRLLAGSIDGLDFENVSVISDRSRFLDISVGGETELISPDKYQRDYVSIWSIIMTRDSSGKFRTIFFLLIFLIILFAGAIGFLIYKFYPYMMKKEKLLPPKENEEEKK